MRLAFSVATEVDPEILLLDEILAVGDTPFRQKCFDRIEAFRQAGKTILFVSHDMQHILKYCDRAVLLEKGEIMAQGEPDEVIKSYMTLWPAETVAAMTTVPS
jgi:ABC-type polysaccharide/polyol phosphate transport system ATPase subunit